MSRFDDEEQREREAREGLYRWVQMRTEAIRRKVTAHDVLRRNGITLRHSTDREEQFPCPFHGVDTHPSARIYPETVKGASHVWCFVCQKHWDCIGLWKKFTGDEAKFTRVLAEMERAFGISPPERPPSAAEMAEHEDPETIEVEQLMAFCEVNLSRTKRYFDMKAHLTIGSVLDRVRYQFERGQIKAEKVKEVLAQMMVKMKAREKACPDG
jgi:hypothetical protein